MARVLFVSLEPFGPLMAGPGVRCRELAAACAAAGLEVTVAVPGGMDHMPEGCAGHAFEPIADDALADAVGGADAVVAPGTAPARLPALIRAPVPLVVDLYCPFLIENLERNRQDGGANPDTGALAYLNELRGLNAALARGDFFVCADARQRDYWIGALTALHRVAPATYRDDPQLARLIATVPFGCPAEPPAPGEPVMRGVVHGIGADAEIVLWGGSLSPWFDFDTLIRAFGRVRERRPAAALVFLGVHHPNPEVPASPTAEAAQALAKELDLRNAGVHFLPWIPYAERGRYLTEAKLGVSTHGEHLEAHFAFRTRLIDYAWAGLPMVLTRADAFGTRCSALGAALAVEPGDVDSLAAALVRGLEDEEWRTRAVQACERLARDLEWPRVAEPLCAWLKAPQRAADAAARAMQPPVVPPAGGAAADVTAEELAALRAEAERARELDGRLRALDRKVRLLLKVPGVAALLKRARGR